MSKELKKVFIIYEYFYPAYKAGGIIRSLQNIIEAVGDRYDFYVFTGGYDLNDRSSLAGIELNQWKRVALPNSIEVNIWYDDKKSINPQKLYRLLQEADPQTIYINGFMSLPFLFYPLLCLKFSSFRHVKTIIAPRGMLQAGAVGEKAGKKAGYLLLIKWLGLTKNCDWHITSESERAGIEPYLSKHATIYTVGNIPQLPIVKPSNALKEVNRLRIVYASIITPKKGLLELLEALPFCKHQVSLSIYGVIKEEVYWNNCLQRIEELPSHIVVNYCGIFQPNDAQNIFSKHDAAILLSKGENFSHAIFEALGAARPVITSNFTSWDNLETKYAGWNVPLEQPQSIADAIDSIAIKQQEEWNLFCEGAYATAKEYLATQSFGSDYYQLFNS